MMINQHGFPYSPSKPAKEFLADCVNNLSNLLKSGQEPTMDIILFGVTFEFRIKPQQVIFSPLNEQKND